MFKSDMTVILLLSLALIAESTSYDDSDISAAVGIVGIEVSPIFSALQ